ncbi:DNA repair exonuclease [Ignavigranum ruoffiae]|uniref:metallophosphoesterase family protein n=1 Tax=Ignavigranum ruoffiae TaxID=89093 RepID=UPI002070375B|nr:DNA repair exonuclease [Ignavigranum ruoffiae]UPQ85262.1 DNA repair exonuclease [Ignavigranum ruoffiae]
MRIMHVADLHLDTPFVGMGKDFQAIQGRLLESAYIAFERCVNVAINRKVDLMLIVGDVYDAQKQTVKAQYFFHQQLERLSQAGIPVVFCHGNHDYMTASVEGRQYPEGIHVFRDNKLSFIDLHLDNSESVRIYGFSYKNQWIADRMIDQFPTNPYQTTYTIGMIHGELASKDASQTHYAPFTLEDLLDKHYDYWALGHIHQANVLHQTPLIQYPGTIQGRHRNETGPKGAYIIELNQGQPTGNEFIELSPIIWQKVELNCQWHLQAADLLKQIQHIIANYQSEAQGHDQSYILEIELNHAERLDDDLQTQISQGQLLEAIQDELDADHFVVVAKISLNRSLMVSAFEYDRNLNQSFEEAYTALNDDKEYQSMMAPLENHPTIQTYLKSLIMEEELRNEISKGARDLVVQSLGFDQEGEATKDED